MLAQELSVRNNRLTALPVFLNSIKSLQVRCACEPRVAVLRSLQVLNASDNNLEQVPVPICVLPRLRSLDLSGNRIRFLPPQVADSSTLTSLSLHANDLRQLPASLASMARSVCRSCSCCAL
jgi:internalin A